MIAVSSQTVLAGVNALLLLANGYLALDGPIWERRAGRRESKSAQDALVAKLYKQRPTQVLYELAPLLCLPEPVKSPLSGFLDRAILVAELEPTSRDAAIAAALQWASTVGQFAAEASTNESSLALRAFLATYHLGVIREGSVAVPVLLHMLARGELTDKQIRQFQWGVGLLNLAFWYNSVARQQREPVYFTKASGRPQMGPILRAPVGSTWWFTVADLCSPSMRLHAWRRLSAARWIKRTCRGIAERGRDSPEDPVNANVMS